MKIQKEKLKYETNGGTSMTPTPDISICPGCGGEADNGFDREDPPNPFHCSKCANTPTKSSFPMPYKENTVYSSIVNESVLNDWAKELQKYCEGLEEMVLTLSGKVGANSGYLRAYKERLGNLEDVVGAIVLHNTSKQCETQPTHGTR